MRPGGGVGQSPLVGPGGLVPALGGQPVLNPGHQGLFRRPVAVELLP